MERTLRFDITLTPVVNYALQQNRVKMIQEITLINDGDVLEDLELRITASPAICLPYQRHIDLLPAATACRLDDINPVLDVAFLGELTEKIQANLHFSIERDGQILYAQDYPVTALAFDEWQGCGYYPELLTAFVTPNHPEIINIIARSADYLGQWTADPSIDGYQTGDSNRALAQAGAIYAALQEQRIRYAMPPASFEAVGQRVRLCDGVMQQKLGTCLDLTLLYAGCLEAAGLHPLLILKEGHIFAGVWLEDQTFPEAVQDDSSLLTKRLAKGVNEIAVVECTLFTDGKDADFDSAMQCAAKELSDIEYFIDVRRSRLSGITPLPLRIPTDSGWRIENVPLPRRQISDAPAPLEEKVHIDCIANASPATRQTQWERKLLDLGLRNQLINMRLTKTILPIMTTSLDDLENALSDGKDFSILSRPSDWPVKETCFDTMHDLGTAASVIQSEFGNRRLRTIYTDAELGKTIKDLYRNARTALEENGANTLYLALGLLRWYETDRSTKARYAPIMLVPVDILRKSAAQGYVIRLRDEEPQMNITMLEKLKQDSGITVEGLDPLPQDEHGIDVRRVLTILRKAVMSQKRWDTLESAYLGIFSFSQFVMWNDIRNRCEDLQRSKIVRSLIDGKLAWDATDMKIGSTVPESDVLLPMAADASQLFAIQAACNGESFVLHGPPGTGKSQTITGLIANALAQEKTVLFVAEKMAALEVVQKRLENMGLGSFCLELHSNKSKKKNVLEQLRRATEVTKQMSPEAFAAKAEQISVNRKDLDGYAQALHQAQPCGKSLFQLIDSYELVRSADDIRLFTRQQAQAIDKNRLEKQHTMVERLIGAAKAVGHPAHHPLAVIGCKQYSQTLRNALRESVAAYRQSLERLGTVVEEFAAAIGEESSSTKTGIERLSAIGQELELWLKLPREWAECAELGKHLKGVLELAQHHLMAQAHRDWLTQCWKEDFLSQNGAALAEEYKNISEKWFLPKALGKNSFSKRLQAWAKESVPKEDLFRHLDRLSLYQRESAAAQSLLAQYGVGLEILAQNGQIDWQAIVEWVQRAIKSAKRLIEEYRADSIRLRCAGVQSLQPQIQAMNQAWAGAEQARAAFLTALQISPSAANPERLDDQLALLDEITAHADQLKEWILWSALADEARALDLGSIVDAYMNGMGHEQILPAYEKACYQSLAMLAIEAAPVLNTFSGAQFNEKIEQFKRLDKELTALTRQEIYCRLASRIPNFTKEAAHSSEVGILQRAIRSGGRGQSIRKLFEQIPELLPRLCPCMLMSPISAAQYLDPKREPFHLVVFDEASQMPTCKAVGALARGQEAVIVGDPKQMPPTAFFATNSTDEEALDTEDLESILDDCLAMNMPQTHLLWHYRSRHESLIAYSNNRFYDSKLFTFPSVNDRASKVRLVNVDGVFDRGKSRQNRAEAEAVVEELKRRCYDSELSGQSVGVVTFNVNQQHLIDDLLTAACATDPTLEKWVYESAEPVFIKNLENVQGDERDVILFSIGYGPDESGKVYMNFGPLNRDGGWRRLNVAISRARQEMVVYATLKPDQINLSKTSAEGVAALKGFLEYAGGKPLPEPERTVRRSFQPSGIAQRICRALQAEGYQTDLRVGRSEYRIDIGVVDPEDPERYLLGILLDGDSYGTAKTTRDREIAQMSVLTGLGWNLIRVWSMDWWDNTEKELGRILRELERLRAEGPDVPSPEPEASTPEPTPTIVPEEPEEPEVYTATSFATVALEPEEFLSGAFRLQIRGRIHQVLLQEAPVRQDRLIKTVVQSFGISRATGKIQTHMETILSAMALPTTTQEEHIFYWLPDQGPEVYDGFRCNGDVKRDIREVAVQELANGLRHVLSEQLSMSREDLLRQTVKLLGYARLGGNVTVALENALAYAQSTGTIAVDSNGICALSEAEKTLN
ncbi:MAG: DUF3320 domain-containing protein [Ruminococcaceae bacterium]|nr:DUF3320 domain-containing protein [Oscillospiraceae bacterium]